MTPGTRVGPYEIVAPIGAGGMGEVYRARDAKLGRDVAIKILPPALADDGDRLARFEREARLLASLNHPNIGAIYGLESLTTTDPARSRQPALILELIDGDSLIDSLRKTTGANRAHHVRAVLTIARQIAEALDAAHERGVIHRDLKPGNIKVTSEGVVKVLDFGLAKAAGGDDAHASSLDVSQSPTVTIEGTQAGVILGTAAYMSPEQARGRPVDKRTDIWSFGCVLYEMLAGRLAFSGETTSDFIAAILEREPDYTRLPAATPSSVRRLIQRCLEKDVRKRLRDIADARAEIDDALSAPASTVVSSVGEGRPRGMRPPAWQLASGAVLLSAAAAAMGSLATTQMKAEPSPVFDRVVRLVSTSAHEYAPAISPDGKWVAYLSNARGPTDVWVKFIAGGDPANLTANAGIDIQSTDYVGGLQVSPDGTQIAVTATDARMMQSAWTIPAPLGGVPRRVLPNSHAALHWSPDGKRIAFVRTGGPLGDALVVADPDGQNEVVVAKRQGAQHNHWVQWSPDGAWLYFNHGPQNFNIEPTEIYRVPATGGEIEPVVSTPRRAAFPFLTNDGRALIYAANPDSVDLSLWWRDLKSGKTTRLTTGVGEYTHPNLSSDGQRLVGTVIDARQALEKVTVAFDRPVVLEPITDGFTGDFDPAWSPDGSRMVFSSSRSGNRTLWAVRDRSQPAQITSGTAIDERPAFSPDGQQIAFVSDRGGRRGIWVVSAEGGTPRFVAAVDVVDTISWSPDGQRLVYSTPIGDAPGLSIMTVADGKTTRLPTPAAATGPSWSRDDVIAFIEPRGGAIGAYAQLIRPDGQRVVSSPLDGPGAPQIANGALVWSADGKRLAAAALPGAGAGTVWIIEPANPSPYRKLMDLPAGVFVRGMSWARDGSSLFLGRYRWSGDIFMAEEVNTAVNQPQLTRAMGLLQATATNVISMVGVGPFLTIPFMVAAMNGPHVIYAWVAGLVLALADGLVYAQLGAALPGSGGGYLYLREAFQPFGLGKLMAFLFIFQTILIAPLSVAGGAVGFADYLQFVWTAMTPLQHNAVAAAVCVAMTALLWRDIEEIGRLAVVMLVVVLLTVGWVIVAGLFTFSPAQAFDFPPEAFSLDRNLMMSVGAASVLAMYSYGGYNQVCNIGDEIRDPTRTIPRSIVLSTFLVAALYMLMTIVILGMIPWPEVRDSRTVASVFIARTFADPATGQLAGMVMTGLILFVAAASLYATILGYSRVPYAAARDGDFFRVFARVHPTKRFPDLSLATIAIVSIPFCFFTLGQLVSWLIQVQVLLRFIWQCAAVVLLRRYRPDIPQPFTMWLYPWPAILSGALWLFIFFTGPWEGIVFSVAFLAAGVAVYGLFRRRRHT